MVCLGLRIFPRRASRCSGARKWPIGCLGACVLTFCREPYVQPAKVLLLVLLCWEVSQPLPVLSVQHSSLLLHFGCWQMGTGLPPQPQSSNSPTSLSTGSVCLLSCHSCPGWSQIWGSGISRWLQKFSRSLQDWEVPMVTDVADTASSCIALLAQHLLQCLPSLASSRALIGFPSPSGHKH